MKNNYIGSIYLTLAACIWGGMYVVSKIVLTVVTPLELVWLRYLVALTALVLAGLVTRCSWRIKRQDLPLILAIGIIGYAISITAQFTGTKLSSAQMGSVITAATPAFMVIFARILLQEKVTWRKGLSVGLATLGVLLIIGVRDVSTEYRLGGAVLMLAALTWALISVLVKRIPGGYSRLVVTTYGILTATVLITPFVIPQIDQTQIIILGQPQIWGGVLYLGIVATAGAFYLWNKGMQLVEAAKGSIYFFFQPLTGALLGWLILDEQVDAVFWIGTLLIFAGVLLVIKEPE